MEWSHNDEWGNDYFICPACGAAFKKDGVWKHIASEAKRGNPVDNRVAHKKLLAQH